jgi:hypothetical protein
MCKYLMAALVAGVIGVASTDVAPAEPLSPSERVMSPSELSAQRARRARPRITVHPRRLEDGSIGRSGNRFDEFPRPYRYEWPGPNAHRECIGWLEPEYRVTGTVIVPRRRCRWVPG